MTIHTRSFFLAVASLINIFMSIPIAICIYTYFFKVTYFSSLHLSIIIIIVGIGADDIFVFHDCWQNSFCIGAIKNESILRLSYSYKQASKQMLVTSLTSAVAFLSCTSSKIMPIRSFGIFATLVVLICFITTTHVQPILYFIYEEYFMGKCCSVKAEVKEEKKESHS